MQLLEKIRTALTNLDEQDFYRYAAFVLGGLLLCAGIIIYHYESKTSVYIKQARNINKERERAQDLLTRYEYVKQQQTEVSQLLNKDKNFKIREYFEGVIKNQALTSHVKKVDVAESELGNGYSEIRLDASVEGINTKILTELLYEIEQKERVYTKELEIKKPSNSSAINVTLVIATLQPQTLAE